MEGFREPFEARKGVVSGVELEAGDASAIQSPARSTKREAVIVGSGFEGDARGRERWDWTSVVVLG